MGIEHYSIKNGTLFYSEWNIILFRLKHYFIKNGTLFYSESNNILFGIEHYSIQNRTLFYSECPATVEIFLRNLRTAALC